MNDQLPILGAAMRSDRLPEYADWLKAEQRDLEIQDPAWPEVLDGDWRSVTANIRSMLDGHTGRRGVHAPFVSLTLAAVDARIRAVVQERFKQTLDFCAEIGASHMVVHSPLNFLGTPFIARTGGGEWDAAKVVHDTLDVTLRYAEEVGCTLVMENIYDRDPGLLVGLVKSFESDHLKVSIDTGHAYINYQQGAPPVDYWLREAGALLAHLHLQDTDGYADRHWVPGDGRIDWWPIFEVLGKLDHQPRLILELMDQSAIRRAAQWFADRSLAR